MKPTILLLFIFSLSSCLTVRNAERRHDRIIKNFPNVHKADTVEIERTILVDVNGVDAVDTVFYPVFWKDTIRDTIYFPNNIRVIVKNWHVDSLQNGRTTEIYQPDQQVEAVIKEKQVTIYQNTPLKWHQKWWGIGIIIFCSGATGWILSKFDERLNKKDD